MIDKSVFLQYLKAGLSVIPCSGKIPRIPSWLPYKNAPAAAQEAQGWPEAEQVAIICGQVSGGLICLDFDVKNGDKYGDWAYLINAQAPALLSRLVVESSPSGGCHVIFRTDYKIGNVKLAINPDNKCTIETRGEGGYFVCAPSPGYELQYGHLDKVQKITLDETELLINAARSLNERHAPEAAPVGITQSKEHDSTGGISPFDDYDAKNTPHDDLVSAGWKMIFQRGQTTYYRRPDKSTGISASWNAIPGRFYVFSTSTVFENNHVYKPSAVYAILQHGGDYSAAATQLSAGGYGKRAPAVDKRQQSVTIVKTDGMVDSLIKIKREGYKKGKTTGWHNLDRLYSVIKGQFSVITGMPSHGKSEFTDALMINLASEENWKFAVYSPENYPVELHFHKLVEKVCGDNLRMLNDEQIQMSVDFINKHFFFIDGTEEEITIDAIMDQTEALIKTSGIDGLVIDPWNEIELSKPRDISDSDFIGMCLRKLRKFARKHNVHLWIVAHPTKMLKDKNGKYPIPELYDIMGSSHWRNKADNGISVYRNFENNTTEVYVMKVKFRYAGEPGMCVFKYNEKGGLYEPVENVAEDFHSRMG